ncbi:amidohydrolase family protein [Mucilaginibacter sp. L3T2-6]|uniref:amidohydrolase family protein n=1 Tax=Mucilaginibacter sp. L3T2-6 TaxID=3062491 RepID=UPI002675FB9A|nr:amidohydrolase family protein [Mucilaginibacter sp. L3T2-6]MDO3643567.1 amidohydrolase family protein [Mucilaginibacter sp. L3T2-6]MDV6216018.1 amidohydrolase family protein [Mucilaginibacter sp. L3T2-6]
MKKLLLFCCALFFALLCRAQETFPVNGPYDIRPGQYAFTNANIVVNPDQTITNGTLLVKDRVIEAVGAGVKIPKGYVTIDLKGKYIYPSLIDAYTTYGIPEAPRQAFGQGFGFGRPAVRVSTKPGAYGWNEAIRPEMNAKAIFRADEKKAEDFKKNGFGTVHSVIDDGIARGTSAVVTLGDERENFLMLKDEAAANYSFSKGTATTNYPSSLMGAIALLRQTYYDAQWYKNQKEEYNISLDEFNRIQNLPQVFEVGDPQAVLRANKIGKEFGKQYIFKTDGQEYRRIDAMKATGGSFIIPLKFPEAFDVEDPLDARNVSYTQLKDWELAPTNPAVMEKAGIKFAITSDGLTNARDFWTNLRTAMDNGLSEKQALSSLTTIPAEMLGVSDKVGSLAKGKLANFIITSDDLFKKDNIIYENWIEGRQYVVSKMDVTDLRGNYTVSSDALPGVTLKIGGSPGTYDVSLERTGTDSTRTKGNLTRTGDLVSIYFDLKSKPSGNVRLNGYITKTSPLTFTGSGILPDGSEMKWTATYSGPAAPERTRPEPPKQPIAVGPVVYPFTAYGLTEHPKAETTLFKNATVWTSEKEGILQNTDVLIENGKIKAIGKNLAAGNATVIDATGKHLSPGIVDEHSHIAASGSINEGTQAVSAEVRIADVLNAEDINLYRQLAGGVTTSHILHGSANPIGGQTQLIKHRWGVLPDEMKFEGADGFIKFALGENVKGSNNGFSTGAPRFPQTRMGVEEVYIDEFTRAKEYKAARLAKNSNTRRDLELDAIVEIMDGKRFITCHSYVQSEINMLMHVADSMGFKINTFTHILEGYKMADKMKAHGIAGSTFSDWWAYKNEVAEAIPYNGKLMHDMGVVTAFNSDDEEMARRLNQEAGKAVTYGHMSEEEALKLVTINPATMLHVDKRIGSIKVGKDADLVLWSADPLSVYAVAEKTYVDGIPYWDIDKDAANQKAMKADEARIIQKMIAAKNKGAATQRPTGRRPRNNETDEDDEFVSGDIDGVGQINSNGK